MRFMGEKPAKPCDSSISARPPVRKVPEGATGKASFSPRLRWFVMVVVAEVGGELVVAVSVVHKEEEEVEEVDRWSCC